MPLSSRVSNYVSNPRSQSARALRSLEALPYASNILALRPEGIVMLITRTLLGLSLSFLLNASAITFALHG
ncbi:hypothetical protein Tco_1249227, partial [Tanacetum coccineum]